MPKKGTGHQLKGSPEYRAWVQMRQRCSNENRWEYPHYGGRGIAVCVEWDDPVRFVADMGPRPSEHHQIDRENNDLGYFKENCRWVLRKPQMQNTRLSKRWFVNGVEYPSLSEASAAVGITPPKIKAWCEGRTEGKYKYPPKPNCWSEKKYD